MQNLWQFCFFIFISEFPLGSQECLVNQKQLSLQSRQRLCLKGGSASVAEIVVDSKESFRQVVESCVSCRIWMNCTEIFLWDWRDMCPWAKELSDEKKEFPLEPMPKCKLHILPLQTDRPAHLDGQWKMGRTRSGSFRDVHLSLFTDVPDARVLFKIYGGPWTFESCEVRPAFGKLERRKSFICCSAYSRCIQRRLIWVEQVRAAGCQVMRLERQGESPLRPKLSHPCVLRGARQPLRPERPAGRHANPSSHLIAPSERARSRGGSAVLLCRGRGERVGDGGQGRRSW